MGFWKILGGAALGVGCVAAAPFTGGGSLLAGASIAASLAGAGTVAAAAAAGTAGAIAASKMGNADKEAGKREGREEERANFLVKEEKMIAAIQEAEKRLKDDKDYFNLILALTAMGLATANIDDNICEEELEEINLFVSGVANSSLPPHIKGQITRMYNDPPTFNTAMTWVKKVDRKSWPLFEEVIKVVSNSDNYIDERETALLEAWRRCANE